MIVAVGVEDPDLAVTIAIAPPPLAVDDPLSVTVELPVAVTVAYLKLIR